MMMLLNSMEVFKPSEINELLNKDFKFVKSNKQLSYMNIPVSFDIETTSFYNTDGMEQATMYAWIFCINGKSIIGRTWDEFLLILDKLRQFYELNDDKRIIIWIHNLSFEFAFMQNIMKWDKVFAVDKRKPVYAISNGIEFRCSYILSGYSLNSLAKNLTSHKIQKMVGDLDYSLLRHSKTPLSKEEYGYILNDGLIVNYYIAELISQYGDLHKLPLTNTGFVRKYVRKECLYGGMTKHKGNGKYYKKYHSLMKCLKIPTLQSYEQMKRVYTGGFTHCNGLYNGIVIENVTSYDFTSSYPSVMVCEKFPMSTPIRVRIKSKEDLKRYMNVYCCMFDLVVYNLKPKLIQDHPLSESKCIKLSNDAIVDNGRVVSASQLITSMNEIDFEVFNDFYSYDKIEFYNFYIMEKSYLPKPFVLSVLKLYELKTTLKGSTDLDDLIRYMNAKGQLNSTYGMCVTDIMQTNHNFKDGEWIDEEPNIKELFDKYNNSKSRFLYYPWGIWVTSYARRNLFLGIQAMGRDYIYSDTDSIKIRNGEMHKQWIDKYNKHIEEKIKRALEWHKIDFSMASPKTIKGNNKTIGFWDFDGFYTRFKTLGAKRYIYEENNEMHLTCAGVSKKSIDYMMEQSNQNKDKCFDFFKMNMFIPSDRSGKNIHTYIDFEMKGTIIDYLGNKSTYHELSGVHLTGAEYTLSLSKEYIDYLNGINWGYEIEE